MRDILAGMPELPESRRARLIAEYGLSTQDAATLTTDRELGDQFGQAAKLAKSPKRVASILLSEITMRLRAAEITLDKSPVSLDGIVLAADLAESGAISSKQLKQLLDTCFAEGRDFANLGATDISGHDYLTIAPAFRWKINECVQFGIATEFAITSPKDFQEFRLLLDMIFRY